MRLPPPHVTRAAAICAAARDATERAQAAVETTQLLREKLEIDRAERERCRRIRQNA